MSTSKKHLILFVHGLGGSEDSFVNSEGIAFKEYFCDEIKEVCDFKNFVYTSKLISFKFFSFLSNISQHFSEKLNHEINEISELLKTYCENHLKDYESINFICHSMGGLIVKDLLLYKKIKFNVPPFYITLATPHQGSTATKILILAEKYHSQVKALKVKSEPIIRLNEAFKYKKNDFKRRYYYAIDDVIVEKNSAYSEGDELNLVAVEGNHISICKPSNSVSAQTLLKHINNTVMEFLSIESEKIDFNIISHSASKADSVCFISVDNHNIQYYLERSVDLTVQRLFQDRNLWIHAPSGLGKTNLAQYFSLSKKADFIFSVYFSDYDKTSNGYFLEIFESLDNFLKNKDIHLIYNSDNIFRKIKTILSYLSTTYQLTIIHLDEFSLDQCEFDLFWTNFISSIMNGDGSSSYCHIRFIITSILNPDKLIEGFNNLSYQAKTKQLFTFLELEHWTDQELISLYNIISTELKIEVEDIGNFLTSVNKCPRELKIALKQKYSEEHA